MIEICQLHKRFGSVHAVKNLSFCVKAGTVVGFLGPNGAGKSTTLRILAGFIGPSAGSVTIAGHDMVSERQAALRNLGYMPETSPLYPEMRVHEYLQFRAALKAVTRSARGREIDRVLQLCRIGDVQKKLIGHLSKGYRQRVGLADALLGAPPLLLLDEPTAGLDPNQIRQVRTLIRDLAGEHTVLLSTHILTEVEAICDTALVLHDGELVASGSLAELRDRATSHTLALCISGKQAPALALLRTHPLVDSVIARTAPNGTHDLSIKIKDGNDVEACVEELVFALVAAKVGIRRLTRKATSLDDVFQKLTAISPHGSDAVSHGNVSHGNASHGKPKDKKP